MLFAFFTVRSIFKKLSPHLIIETALLSISFTSFSFPIQQSTSPKKQKQKGVFFPRSYHKTPTFLSPHFLLLFFPLFPLIFLFILLFLHLPGSNLSPKGGEKKPQAVQMKKNTKIKI